jgi:hypothetical protein
MFRRFVALKKCKQTQMSNEKVDEFQLDKIDLQSTNYKVRNSRPVYKKESKKQKNSDKIAAQPK